MRPTRAIVIALAPLALAACAPPKQDEAPPIVVHTPLEHDPMQPFNLGVWWTDDRSLLRLGTDGGYAIWDGRNRYADPGQTGRWVQESYAFLWLEPYQGFEPQRNRVMIRRHAGEIRLITKDGRAWHAIDAPPRVLEDRLLGAWTASGGELVLHETGRYRYVPADDPAPGKSITAGHRGRWRVRDHVLSLDPDPAGLGPYALAIAADAESVVLTSDHGTYVKRDRAAVAGP